MSTFESRKLSLIEAFLRIDNEHVISMIEALIREEEIKNRETKFTSVLSEVEFNEMIDRAENDASEGKVYTSSELRKQIYSWR